MFCEPFSFLAISMMNYSHPIGYDHPLTLFVEMLVPNARTLSHPHHGLLDTLNCTLYAVGCQRRNPNVALRGKGEAASPAVVVPRRFSYRDLKIYYCLWRGMHDSGESNR